MITQRITKQFFKDFLELNSTVVRQERPNTSSHATVGNNCHPNCSVWLRGLDIDADTGSQSANSTEKDVAKDVFFKEVWGRRDMGGLDPARNK